MPGERAAKRIGIGKVAARSDLLRGIRPLFQ